MGASLDNNEACPQHQELHFCTLCEKCVGSLASPANQYREDAGDGTNKLLLLCKKTRMSNCLWMSKQRQLICFSYFKTLIVCPVWGMNPWPSSKKSGAQQQSWVDNKQLITFSIVFIISDDL